MDTAARVVDRPPVSAPEAETDPQGQTTTYPSVDLAYEFVRPSYEHMLRRLDGVEGRLRAVQTFAGTVTVAAPAVIAATVGRHDPRSPWFVAAMLLFVAVIVIGIAAVRGVRFRFVDPGRLYRDTLHLSQWDFKVNSLDNAAQHFATNKARVDRIANAVDIMSAVLLVEILCLAIWAVLPGLPSPS